MLFFKGQKFIEKFQVTTDIYNLFKDTFQDKNKLHTNKKFALSKGFKGCVMYGNILNGFISYFIGECLPEKDIIIHSQEIYFKNAVYKNDKLILTAYVSDIFESVETIQLKYSFTNSETIIVAKGIIQIGILK
jgi:3-hydroxybutyryl-CoA dehydratase